MKLESERVPETDASPELAAELLRDGARRGAWLSLRDEEDADNVPAAGASVTRKGLLVFLAALVAAFLSADLVIRFELYYIGNCGPLSECLDPLALYTEFIEMANTGAWSDCFGALFEVGILPVPLVAAAVCTAVWKTFRKAIPLAALAAALVEVFWFFPFAAGCLC